MDVEFELVNDEYFAAEHSDQWIGCLACRESHHVSNFCSCGACFFKGIVKQVGEYTFVKCYKCDKTDLWD